MESEELHSKSGLVVSTVPVPRLAHAQLITEKGTPASERAYQDGAVYCHVHSSVIGAKEGLSVSGTSASSDSHISPGGREGAHRLGLRPGMKYTISVEAVLTDPLVRPLNKDALRIVIGCDRPSGRDWRHALSDPATNEVGRHRISVTFILPNDASGSWIRLVSGAAQGRGQMAWDRLMVVEGEASIPYFDGDTPDTNDYKFGWGQLPGGTRISTRQLRQPADVLGSRPDPESSEDQTWQRHAFEALEARVTKGLFAEAETIKDYLGSTMRLAWAEPILKAMCSSAEGELDRALEIVDEVVQAQPLSVPPLRYRAHILSALRRYREAAGTLQEAGRLTSSLDFRYDLARSLERAKFPSAATKVTLEAASRDAEAPFDALEAARIEPRRLGIRRVVGAFVRDHLAEIHVRAAPFYDSNDSQGTPVPRNIFTLWLQGYESAPPIVKACHAALLDRAGTGTVHALTESDLPYYSEIPELVRRRVGDAHAQLSDLYRLDLLARYGGVWLDATCLPTEPVFEAVDAISGSGFFAFNHGGPRISSWFLAARRHNYIVAMLRAAMLLWWEREGYLIDYFLLHHLFEVLYWIDPKFAVEWDAHSPRSAQPPHRLQKAMLLDVDEQEFQRLLESSFVHKLKYKFPPDRVGPRTAAARVVRAFNK